MGLRDSKLVGQERSPAGDSFGFAPNSPQFVPYQCGPLRGLCVRGYEGLDLTAIPWDQLRHTPDPNHHLAKASRTRRVVRLEFTPPDGSPKVVYAKRVLLRDWRKRLGALFVSSKARREWVAGYRLSAMGLRTARPVVFAEQKRGPWLVACYLVTEQVEGARPLRDEIERLGSTSRPHDLLAQLAAWLWDVHRRGFYHDDCSAAHVFVSQGQHEPPDGFWLIDLDNCRFHRRTVPWRRRTKNLFQVLRSIAGPLLSPTDRLRFVQSYLEASGEGHRLRRAVARLHHLAHAKKADIQL